MHLEPDRIEAIAEDWFDTAPFGQDASLGPLVVDVVPSDGWSTWAWSVANRGDRSVRVRSVALVFRVVGVVGPLRLLRNGYQSWSPTGVATVGVDVDPSTRANFEFLQGVHHADQRRARDGDLRSEWVTVLADAGEGVVLVGFDGGDRHDGTLRLRPVDGGVELWAEAFLGDARLDPGVERSLHDVRVSEPTGDVPAALDTWAVEVGRRGRARVAAPYQVGWCSWYHYFHDVTEAALRANLARAADWPFDVFQLDDGYQAAIGDWLATNEDFPSSIDEIAAAIAAEGRVPGLWLAPFLVAPDAPVARDHPEWLAGFDRERVLRAWWNPPWGGGEDGFMYALDTSNPEVLQHLEDVARQLVDAGYRYLKLDFTFAPSLDGVWHDPTRTPAERVRAGYDAVRRGAGEDTFILGCGVPLANVVGLVDGNRIGQDVAPQWDLDASDEVIAGYLGTQPSVRFALGNTAARAFMHRRLWLNDPDCIMLRTRETDLAPEAVTAWAQAVGVSGGMALVSDDLALLGPTERSLLAEAVAIGRASDDAAIAGRPVVCPDLLDDAVPHRLRGGGWAIDVDPASGAGALRRA